MKTFVTIAALSTLLVWPALAHHSNAALQMDTVATLEGMVTEYSFRNPHTYFTVASTGENGEAVEWDVQMGSAIGLQRRGWTADTLSIGDRLMVGLHPARDGRPYGLLVSIERDGSPLATPFGDGPRHAAPVITATTTTIEGRWFVDRDSLEDDYPGGLDELMSRDLTPTEAGRAARDAFDQDSEENPELACISKPVPGEIIYTDLFPIEIEFPEGEEIILIRSQHFDRERTVYMDGRGHPDPQERFHEGHSIGHWEGDVLVVDTANFGDHRSPYQNGVPSGPRKHVVERYRLHDDGIRMNVSFILEDPDYIVGRMTHDRDLIYSPHLEMSPFNCDLESARRYLPQQ